MQVASENDEKGGNLGERLLPPTQDTAADTKDHPPKLPLPLRFLYGMNGLTLSLPMTALLYIVNTRASVPVEYLSAFAAIAFLPSSLKPLYACMSQYVCRRDMLMVLLLVASGIFTAVTAFIPRNGVCLCFVLAFCRGVTSSWPEFMLGLCLIQHANECQADYSLAAAHFQSQASTCRNCGSLLATVVAFFVFLFTSALNDRVVTILLVASGTLNLLAAAIAWWFRLGDSLNEYGYMQQDVNGDTLTLSSTHSQPSLCQSLFAGNGLVVIVFQLCIVVFAIQGPIESIISDYVWSFSVLFLVATLVCLVWRNSPVKWQRLHRLSFFLIARHAIPDSSYIVGSFIYSQLESRPIVLQGLSIVTMGVTTLSSWSYGKFLAKYSRGVSLLIVMAGTTIVSSALSLGNLWIVKEGHEDNRHLEFYLILLVVSVVTTFADEWAFLPDVVLATATVGNSEGREVADTAHAASIDHETNNSGEMNGESAPFAGDEDENQQDRLTVCTSSQGIEYASLISCIDFGDQIGAWITVPLVSVLGISRDNDWAGLDEMVLLTALFGVLSLVLLGIIK